MRAKLAGVALVLGGILTVACGGRIAPIGGDGADSSANDASQDSSLPAICIETGFPSGERHPCKFDSDCESYFSQFKPADAYGVVATCFGGACVNGTMCYGSGLDQCVCGQEPECMAPSICTRYADRSWPSCANSICSQ